MMSEKRGKPRGAKWLGSRPKTATRSPFHALKRLWVLYLAFFAFALFPALASASSLLILYDYTTETTSKASYSSNNANAGLQCSYEGEIRITRTDIYFGKRQYHCLMDSHTPWGDRRAGPIYPLNGSVAFDHRCSGRKGESRVVCTDHERLPGGTTENNYANSEDTESNSRYQYSSTREGNVLRITDRYTGTNRFGASTSSTNSVTQYTIRINGSRCEIEETNSFDMRGGTEWSSKVKTIRVNSCEVK